VSIPNFEAFYHEIQACPIFSPWGDLNPALRYGQLGPDAERIAVAGPVVVVVAAAAVELKAPTGHRLPYQDLPFPDLDNSAWPVLCGKRQPSAAFPPEIDQLVLVVRRNEEIEDVGSHDLEENKNKVVALELTDQTSLQ